MYLLCYIHMYIVCTCVCACVRVCLCVVTYILCIYIVLYKYCANKKDSWKQEFSMLINVPTTHRIRAVVGA